MKPYFCYMLRCGDGTIYTGITNDPERRLKVHQSGKGGHYTASHLPVEMVYLEESGEKGNALRRELELKKLTRAQKIALIQKREEESEK